MKVDAIGGELVRTADGSLTVRHAIQGELYHSDRGAIGEARHVYLGEGLEFMLNQGLHAIRVFEVGFGTGLNALLAIRRADELGVQVDYHAIERYPLSHELTRELNYEPIGCGSLFQSLHEASWKGDLTEITPRFLLTKYVADLCEFSVCNLAGSIDVIYFDAFSPEVQPELWTPEIMTRMYQLLRPKGILVTYSSKGLVKESLRTAGFEVARLPGALGKRHMIRAMRK